MKKLMFVLLLLVSFVMLVAVESDPSAVVGYVKYPILTGGNLVAVPMNAGYTMMSEYIAAYNATDEIDYVSFWNNDPMVQNWDTTVNQGGNYFDPDPLVDPGATMYIDYIGVTGFNFYSLGTLPATNGQYTVKTGGNIVMIPLNRSDVSLISVLAMGIAPDECDYLSLWNNDPLVQNWDTTVNQGGDYFDPDPALTIGQPVYVSYIGATDVVWPAGPRGGQTRTSRSSINK
jgi:hypothetical protein